MSFLAEFTKRVYLSGCRFIRVDVGGALRVLLTYVYLCSNGIRYTHVCTYIGVTCTYISIYGCTYVGVGVLVPVWVCQYQEVPVDFIYVLAHRTVDPVFSQ